STSSHTDLSEHQKLPRQRQSWSPDSLSPVPRPLRNFTIRLRTRCRLSSHRFLPVGKCVESNCEAPAFVGFLGERPRAQFFPPRVDTPHPVHIPRRVHLCSGVVYAYFSETIAYCNQHWL